MEIILDHKDSLDRRQDYETTELLSEIHSLESMSLELNDLYVKIKRRGASKEDASLMRFLDPTILKVSVESFTELPTLTNQQASLESLGSKIAEIAKATGRAIVKFFKTAFEWLMAALGRRKSAIETVEEAQRRVTAFTKVQTELKREVTDPTAIQAMETAVAESPVVAQAVAKVKSTYSELVEALVKDPKMVNATSKLQSNQSVLIAILQSVVANYEEVVRNPGKLITEPVDVSNPSNSLYSMQASLDQAMGTINRTLDEFDVAFSAKDPERRSGQATLGLVSRVISELKLMQDREATLPDAEIIEAIRHLDKLHQVVSRLRLDSDTAPKGLDAVVGKIERAAEITLRIPPDIDESVRKNLQQQLLLQKATMVDIVQVIVKLDTLCNFVAKVLADHAAAIGYEITKRELVKIHTKVNSSPLISEKRRKQIEDFVNGVTDYLPPPD